ncbi:MAG: cation:proton antiporter, partial [Candidatus Micrarchaeia archaeon]
MVEDSLIEISFFIILALFGTILSMRMRQPYVVGLLLLGVLAGPHVFALVKGQEMIETFSELGAILLLFAVGIEFSASKLMRHGFRAILITFFKMMVLFFFGYELALYFGLDLTSALFAGAMVAVTSTAILYKMAAEKGTHKDAVMPLLFSMLIVEDVVAVAALTFFSSLGGGAPTYEDKIYSVLVSLGLLGAFYFVVRRHAIDAIIRMTSSFNEEALIFVSFSLCLVMAYMADFFGLSPAIGAFLAGSIIASLPNVRAIERTIRPLLLTFSAFFFLSLGMQVDPAAVWGNLAFAAALTAAFILVCFGSVFTLVYTTGASGRRALLAASSMVVLGEFSLIIAATASGEMKTTLLSVGSFGVVATAMFSSFLLGRQGRLEAIARNNVPAHA